VGASVTECKFDGYVLSTDFNALDWSDWLHMCPLPWPQVLELQVEYMHLQLQPSNGRPGVLQGCTSLRVLHLEDCIVQEADAAFAAIAALPGLRSLTLINVRDQADRAVLGDLQLLKQLTKFQFARYQFSRL
jgi:hypothetical protein